MKVKTYGVPDLTEWHGKVKAGSIEVSVSFTGGTASPSGAQPAYFMTKDPITQFVIEHSKEFKSGFIILVMSQDAPGEHPRMAVPKRTEEPKRTEKPKRTEEPETGESEESGAGEETEESGAGEETEESGAGEETGEPGAGEEGDVLTVEVADKAEAISYLKEHYPEREYTAVKLRTKTAFESACSECGVKFVFA